MTSDSTKKDEIPIPFDVASIVWSKQTYARVSAEFHPFHKHDINVLLHVITTGLGVWGVVQAALLYDLEIAVYVYMAMIGLTTPLVTAVLHTAWVYGMMQVPVQAVTVSAVDLEMTPLMVCGLAVVLGYGLQDVSHWLCCEKTYMDSYMGAAKPWMLIVHSIWLLALVVDCVLIRHFFLPKLLVSRNRNVVVQVASKQACDDLRKWIAEHVPVTPETTHVWPHQQEGTTQQVLALENDASILAGFRRVFAAHHFDVKPIQGMNEIYVTAVGNQSAMSSDKVFYTPHTDGPYWFTPFASCYRVLVGVTPNEMVRTRFNLQHESLDQVIDLYDVVGFDYNRELHWIDHVPNKTNKERRSLVKLHFVVYPKGWHWYGQLVANANQAYNTWARGNFLLTLRPSGMYEKVVAWWIWLTTYFNYQLEENVGWPNVVYMLATYALGYPYFLILTSFRHYCIYIATFAYRQPQVAHGFLMRDAKFFKTVALLHLGVRLLPLVELPNDIPGVLLAISGFATTILATVRLGFVRTYFGSELGFVKPQWIEGFPYGYIAHPMIVGQLWAYSNILYWFWDRLTNETVTIIATHMTFYTIHMVQEMLTSSY